MKTYKVLLFDLDGTISDPKEGIVTSVQYALEKLGVFEEDEKKLESFIGPPLQVSFAEHYGLKEDKVKEAVTYYRDRFKEKGMYENIIYSGMKELLRDLKNKGYILVVATSKPTVFATEIMDYFQLNDLFNDIIGSNLDGTRSNKGDIIEHIMMLYGEVDKKDFLMIGDRKHDIIGANTVGIDSVGVCYGYGTHEELVESRPTYIIEDIEELKGLLVHGEEEKRNELSNFRDRTITIN